MKVAISGATLKSCNSKRSVSVIAPIRAAVRHMRCGELNSTEKPHTPTNAATNRSNPLTHGSSPSGSKPSGCRCTITATAQPASVAIRMMHSTYATRWMPEGKSIFAMSSPPVMSGKPGITNSMAPM